jgi:biotin synthase
MRVRPSHSERDHGIIAPTDSTARDALMPLSETPAIRHDWTADEVADLFSIPFSDLIHAAQCVHRAHFDANAIQVSTLLSIKTGGCPEDCKYCPQSVHYDTGVDLEALVSTETVVDAARAAKAAGATRFCMGAAWRAPTERNLDRVAEMVRAVADEGLETCVTLGMLTQPQAQRLADAGLDYYNHNIDTSREFYPRIITTRSFQDRIETLAHVREAGINVCCGGIIGMGETEQDRRAMLRELANLPEHPQSVPINVLVQVDGTPLAGTPPIAPLELARTIAAARIMMPRSYVRLSAGREALSDEAQALCFLAGANSIFGGDRLLTTSNPRLERDRGLMERLGLRAETA